MARQVKLTTNPSDRKDQRERTKNLIEASKGMPAIQKSPPRYLKGTARTAWKTIVPALLETGYVKVSDQGIIEALCVQIGVYREAYDEVVKHGIQQVIYKPVQDSSGKILEHSFQGYKKNPAVATLDSATAKIKTLSESLGLTPAARAQLLDISDNDKDSPSLADMKSMFGG